MYILKIFLRSGIHIKISIEISKGIINVETCNNKFKWNGKKILKIYNLNYFSKNCSNNNL